MDQLALVVQCTVLPPLSVIMLNVTGPRIPLVCSRFVHFKPVSYCSGDVIPSPISKELSDMAERQRHVS